MTAWICRQELGSLDHTSRISRLNIHSRFKGARFKSQFFFIPFITCFNQRLAQLCNHLGYVLPSKIVFTTSDEAWLWSDLIHFNLVLDQVWSGLSIEGSFELMMCQIIFFGDSKVLFYKTLSTAHNDVYTDIVFSSNINTRVVGK